MENKQFEKKWANVLAKKSGDEFSIFVEPGQKPCTQRQLFLYNYFRIIDKKTHGKSLQKILELGCGRGTLSMYFNKYRGVLPYLSDISEEAVDLARANFDLHHAEGNIFVANAASVPYPDQNFDLIYSIGLLEHLDDFTPVIKEIHRLLKPGGMVASLNIPKKKSVQVLNDWWRRLLRAVNPKITLNKDYKRNPHTPEQYKEAFEKAGFRNVTILEVTPFPLFVPMSFFGERMLALKYRFLLWIRSFYMEEPFAASHRLAQAHFIFAIK